MTYLIKFDKNGRRCETYVAEEQTLETIQAMLDDDFELIPEEDYQLLIGNVDSKEYVRTYDLEGNPYYKEYEPPEPTLDDLKAAKLAEVNAWTAAKITGGFISEATGEPIIYDSDVDTQITVSRMRANCENQRFAELFPDGMECRGRRSMDAAKEVFMLQPDEIIRLDEDLGIHIRQSKIDGWTKQAQVKAAQSKEELEKITLD